MSYVIERFYQFFMALQVKLKWWLSGISCNKSLQEKGNYKIANNVHPYHLTIVISSFFLIRFRLIEYNKDFKFNCRDFNLPDEWVGYFIAGEQMVRIHIFLFIFLILPFLFNMIIILLLNANKKVNEWKFSNFNYTNYEAMPFCSVLLLCECASEIKIKWKCFNVFHFIHRNGKLILISCRMDVINFADVLRNINIFILMF
jgi:hypothetical protein